MSARNRVTGMANRLVTVSEASRVSVTMQTRRSCSVFAAPAQLQSTRMPNCSSTPSSIGPVQRMPAQP